MPGDCYWQPSPSSIPSSSLIYRNFDSRAPRLSLRFSPNVEVTVGGNVRMEKPFLWVNEFLERVWFGFCFRCLLRCFCMRNLAPRLAGFEQWFWFWFSKKGWRRQEIWNWSCCRIFEVLQCCQIWHVSVWELISSCKLQLLMVVSVSNRWLGFPGQGSEQHSCRISSMANSCLTQRQTDGPIWLLLCFCQQEIRFLLAPFFTRSRHGRAGRINFHPMCICRHIWSISMPYRLLKFWNLSNLRI